MVWPFGTRKKDGRTKTGFKYGPSTINRASREMMGEVEGMKDMPEVLPKRKEKKFYKLEGK